jgi:hypothetical protein
MDYLDRLSQRPFDASSLAAYHQPLTEPVLVSGNAASRKLLFASKFGRLHFVTVEESYGERSASLTVKPDSGGAWHLAFNDKPFITFANEALALAAYGEAYAILAGVFEAKAEPPRPAYRIPEESPEESPAAREHAEWLSIPRVVGSIVAVLVLGTFASVLLLRVADRVLPSHSEEIRSGTEPYGPQSEPVAPRGRPNRVR